MRIPPVWVLVGLLVAGCATPVPPPVTRTAVPTPSVAPPSTQMATLAPTRLAPATPARAPTTVPMLAARATAWPALPDFAGLLYSAERALWLIGADGVSRQVAPEPLAYLSPDLARVAYVQNQKLWMADWQTGKASLVDPLSNQAVWLPQWSADGRFLFYVRFDPETRLWDVWSLELESGEQRNVTNTPTRQDRSGPAWPNHPQQLLVYSVPAEAAGSAGWQGELTSVSTNGTEYTVVAQPNGPVSVSADGSRLAYTTDEGLWLLTSDLPALRLDVASYGLADWDALRFGSPAWSSNRNLLASWLYALEGDTWTSGMLVLNLEDQTSSFYTGLWTLSTSDDPAPAPDWDPTGRWLAFWGASGGAETMGLWGVEAGSGTVRPLVQFGDLYQNNPRHWFWSPDGSQIVFTRISALDPQAGVWVTAIETGELQRLSLPAGAAARGWVALPP